MKKFRVLMFQVIQKNKRKKRMALVIASFHRKFKDQRCADDYCYDKRMEFRKFGFYNYSFCAYPARKAA